MSGNSGKDCRRSEDSKKGKSTSRQAPTTSGAAKPTASSSASSSGGKSPLPSSPPNKKMKRLLQPADAAAAAAAAASTAAADSAAASSSSSSALLTPESSASPIPSSSRRRKFVGGGGCEGGGELDEATQRLIDDTHAAFQIKSADKALEAYERATRALVGHITGRQDSRPERDAAGHWLVRGATSEPIAEAQRHLVLEKLRALKNVTWRVRPATHMRLKIEVDWGSTPVAVQIMRRGLTLSDGSRVDFTLPAPPKAPSRIGRFMTISGCSPSLTPSALISMCAAFGPFSDEPSWDAEEGSLNLGFVTRTSSKFLVRYLHGMYVYGYPLLVQPTELNDGDE